MPQCVWGMATVQPSWNTGWIWGKKPRWPAAQSGSLEHLSGSTSQFQSAWGGEGLVLYKGRILCQVTLPQLSPEGEATRLLYVSELLLGRTAPQAGSGQPRPILPVFTLTQGAGQGGASPHVTGEDADARHTEVGGRQAGSAHPGS